MHVRRTRAHPAMISLVSMIDVLMILLIFFMITSTYLDLGMIPMADAKDEAAPLAADAGAGGTALLIRLAPDGTPLVQGRAQDAIGLTALLRAHLELQPGAAVMVLPSGNANAQALVSLLDVVTAAGVQNLRILRLQATP